MANDGLRNFRNKLKLLYLKQILETYTDKENGLSHAEIMELMERKGLDVQPRTLRDDIQCLQDAAEDFDMCIGTNIKDGKEKAHPIRYRVEERLFTPTEVKLLMESVKGIHSLSKEQTEILHKKLESLCSRPEAKKIRSRLAVVGGFKAYWSKKRQHDVLLTNIEVVDRALDEGKKLEVRYYWYSMHKVPTYPRDKKHTHIVSPLVRVLEKGFYYLVAIDEYGRIRHFRMDRMTNTAVFNERNEELDKSRWVNMNWPSYVNNSFGLGLTVPYETGVNNPYKYRRVGENTHSNGVDNMMYTVHLRLTRDLVGVVMDRFGTEVTITPEDKSHFIAVFNAFYNVQFVAWILSLGNKVKILEPTRMVSDIAYYARATGRWHKRVKDD